ncbi:MAG: beta-ketoacyl-ACP synthase II [Caldilineales bacterium]|nr:beta-ketoacyl-ACP synthase II [Caldilineales bacterium]
MEHRRVVVTGLGAVTPVGNDVAATWQSLIAGRSGVDRIQAFDPSRCKSQIAAEVKGFDPEQYMSRKDARHADRYTQFAFAAALQAVEDSCLRLAEEAPHRVGVIIGSGIGGILTLLEQHRVLLERGPRRISPFFIPGVLINTASGHIAIHLGLRGPNLAVVTACATGADAIGVAFETIRRGRADVMLAGGSEAPICELTVAGFENMGALSTRNDSPQAASRPFDGHRDGFVIGEGAGVMVLESLEHAQRRGARIYAEVRGYGNTEDAFHITAPHEEGLGACEAMSLALEEAGLQPEDVDYINAHGTSTPLNDAGETRAIKCVFGQHAYRVPISSTKSMTGHLLGAAGAVEAIVCVKAIAEGIIPPTINYTTPDPACDLDYVPNQARRADVRVALSNAFGFGGHNAVLAFAKYRD